MRTPRQSDPQFKLRLTPEIDEAIEAAVAVSGRTKNSEILFRLEASFDRERRMREQLASSAADRAGSEAREAAYRASTEPLVVAAREAYDRATSATIAKAYVEMILQGTPLDLDKARQEYPLAVQMAEEELRRLGKL